VLLFDDDDNNKAPRSSLLQTDERGEKVHTSD